VEGGVAVGDGAGGLAENRCCACAFADAGAEDGFGIGVVADALSPRTSTLSSDSLMVDPILLSRRHGLL
jgi:hypothetical protein